MTTKIAGLPEGEHGQFTFYRIFEPVLERLYKQLDDDEKELTYVKIMRAIYRKGLHEEEFGFIDGLDDADKSDVAAIIASLNESIRFSNSKKGKSYKKHDESQQDSTDLDAAKLQLINKALELL